jgi:hypothetical protein
MNLRIVFLSGSLKINLLINSYLYAYPRKRAAGKDFELRSVHPTNGLTH